MCRTPKSVCHGERGRPDDLHLIDTFSGRTMYRVARELEFCFGHRLKDYDGKCHNIHGHNAKAVIIFEFSELNAVGMGIDFVKIKRTIGAWIDANLDHKMLLVENDPLVPEFLKLGIPVFTLPRNPTTENMARLIYEQCLELSLPVYEVTVWETPYSYATYKPDAV
jgi:6-pyruvoyltetrahydropterin/6-carboxytetrahydropterin synthase